MSVGAFFTKTITVLEPVARDQWGEPGDPVSKTTKARVVFRDRLVQNANGEEQLSRAEVWLANRTLTTEHKLTIDGTTYNIFAIDQGVGRVGNINHLKLEIV